MTADLRIGFVGFGLRGELARHIHRPGDGSRITALLEPSEDRRQSFRKAIDDDVILADDLDGLIRAELDAAFVLSPDWLHEEQAAALLGAGITVYLEKPMAISIESCDRLLRLAQKLDGKLYVGHNMRHAPFVREMKRLIDSGAIGSPKVAWARHFVGHGGEFYFQDWHADRSKSNSLLLQKGAHDIDVLHWLCGSYASMVSAVGDQMIYHAGNEPAPTEPWWRRPRDQWFTVFPPSALTGLNPVVDVEDVSMLNMRLANGAFASYQQCHFTPDYWRNYTIIGDAGRIENFGNGEPGTVVRVWNKRHRGWSPSGDVEIPIAVQSGGHGGADPRIVAEFLRYVREGGATDTSPVAARYAVAAGCAGAESLRNGSRPVPIPPVPDDVVAYFG